MKNGKYAASVRASCISAGRRRQIGINIASDLCETSTFADSWQGLDKTVAGKLSTYA